jgi:hypothetical protein
MINTNAHFKLRVKVKLELKSSIPIDAITEISSKRLTLGVKARLKKKIIFLIYHFMALTDLAPKAGKGYLSTWEVNNVQCNEILLH